MDLITDSKDERLEFDTLCPDCGPRPLLDEDECCKTCGSSAQGQGVDVVMHSLRAALSRAEAAEAEVKIGAHLVATVGDKNRELENKLSASEARCKDAGGKLEFEKDSIKHLRRLCEDQQSRLAALEKAAEWIVANKHTISLTDAVEHLRAALDAAKEGK